VSETIQAIPTRYAGCHFRSRLEARWAVFFDTLGIRWEYEPQGYVGWNDERYLPDFLLPEVDFEDYECCGIHVEVKSTYDALHRDGVRIGGCIDYNATPLARGLLILGPVPDPSRGWPMHSFLWWRKGVSHSFVALCRGFDEDRWRISGVHEDDGCSGECGLPPTATPTPPHVASVDTTRAKPWAVKRAARSGPEIHDALAAARSARFEHGQSGPT
jgi:hypothetical protein